MAILVPITDDNAVPEAEGRDYYQSGEKIPWSDSS
jgi:hypothetical protein